MRKFLWLASIFTVSAITMTIPSKPEPMTESYKQKRIQYLTDLKNKSVFTDENTKRNEIRYLEDMIDSIKGGVEYERGELDGSLLTNP